VRAKPQFSDDILDAMRKNKSLRIRAGTGQHRFIGIWVVVVRDRVFVRSWSVKPNGWYRMFLKEPRGSIQVADRTIAVRAMLIKSESLRDAIDRALRFAFKAHRTVASLIPEYRQFPSKLLNPAPV
jgi:hypothetical protein